MAIDIDQSFYNTGTASVENGGTVVTGQGTQWISSIRANDIFGTHKGDGVRILSVESNTSLTLAYPWTGETQATAPYEVQFTPYDTGYYPAVRQLLQTMASGNLESFAALVGEPNRVPIFTGAGTMDLIDPSNFGIQDPNNNLSNIANFTGSENQFITFNNSGTPVLEVRRKRLSSNTTINVSTTGDDSTGNLTTPFKTINGALKYIYSFLDLNGFNITIQLADGTYAENITINGNPVGYGKETTTYPISINGNVTTPANVKIGSGTGTTLQALNGGVVSIGGVRYVASDYANNSNGTGSKIYVTGKVELETQTGDHFATGGFGGIYLYADYTILGGALNHIHASEGGGIYYGGTRTVTLTGTPNFTGQFAGCAFGSLFAMNTTFTGSATGRRFLCHYNGQIRTETNNRFLFPGDVAGIVQSGGMYDYPSYAYLGTTTATSLPSGVAAFVNWNSVVANQNDMWNTSGWFQPLGGVFSLHVNIAFQNLTVGTYIYIIIRKNSTDYKFVSKVASGTQETLSINLPHETSNGSDVFQIFARNDGSGANILANSGFTWVSARQL